MSRVLPYNAKQWEIPLILDGRKTDTRRIVKLPKFIESNNDGTYTLYTLHAEGTCYEFQYLEEIIDYIPKPYQPGDMLYVRETWTEWGCRYCEKECHGNCNPGKYAYKATGSWEDFDIKWRPSICMPREAARIWLKVTDVRVERLQDISGGELLKEGIDKSLLFDGNVRNAFDEFAKLWNSTIKKQDLDRYGWDANPWVWVIEFEQCNQPEP